MKKIFLVLPFAVYGVLGLSFFLLASCAVGNVKVSVTKYDKNGNKTYYKDSDGYESWWKYDKDGNEIYLKNVHGIEYWYEYTYWKNGTVRTKTAYTAR